MHDAPAGAPMRKLRARRAALALPMLAAVFLAACQPAAASEFRSRVDAQRQANGETTFVEVASDSANAQTMAQAAADSNLTSVDGIVIYLGKTKTVCSAWARGSGATTTAAADAAAARIGLYAIDGQSAGYGAVTKDGRTFVFVTVQNGNEPGC